MNDTLNTINDFPALPAPGDGRPRNRPAEPAANCNCPMGALARLLIDALLADIETGFTVAGKFPNPEARIGAARRCALLARKFEKIVTGTDPLSSEIAKAVDAMMISPIRRIGNMLMDGDSCPDIENIAAAVRK